MTAQLRSWVTVALLGICAGLASGAPQVQADRLQRAVDTAMAAKQGAAVVLDVSSGRLLASFKLETAARRRIRPGSVIKPFTLAALVDANIVKAKTSLMCARKVRLAGRNLDCSHTDAAEPLDAAAALAYSCNFFFTKMAERMQPDALARAFEQAGLTSPTGLVANEVAGTVQHPGSTEALQLMAVGEGSVEVTPLGLASAYRKLAMRIRSEDASVQLITEGLKDAVRYGTAQLARPSGTPALAVAGKTGTATAEGGASHGWFAGYAPAGHPEIVVIVFLERGSGSGDAAPVAAQIFESYPWK